MPPFQYLTATKKKHKLYNLKLKIEKRSSLQLHANVKNIRLQSKRQQYNSFPVDFYNTPFNSF
jgi:hypothetical protein